jgi:hypothetical protein
MTYDADEISVQSGEPIELHRFQLRGGETEWRYTTAEYAITYNGDEYKPEPGLRRDDDEHRGVFGADELVLNCLPDNKFVMNYLYVPPEGVIDYTLFRGHDTNFIQKWYGPVIGVQPILDGTKAKIVIGTLANELDKQMNYLKFQRQCVARLYSDFCGRSKTPFVQTGVIGSVSGNTIVSNSLSMITGDDWWTGGEFTANGYTRKVLSHVTDTITIIYPIPGLAANMSFSIVPGCNHISEHCRGRFNHYKFYKGQPFIPDDEPFTQNVL